MRRCEEEKNGIGVTIAYPGKINTNISLNAVTGTGEVHGEMDHNQATGMSAEECAVRIIKAIESGKIEIWLEIKRLKWLL